MNKPTEKDIEKHFGYQPQYQLEVTLDFIKNYISWLEKYEPYAKETTRVLQKALEELPCDIREIFLIC